MALRAWLSFWEAHRLALSVRGDNMTMLQLVLTMRPSSWRSAIIAREIALDVASGHYVPTVAVHTPGIAHQTADALSRLSAPGYSDAIPAVLKGVTRTEVPRRHPSYYRSLNVAATQMGSDGASSIQRNDLKL